MTEFLTTLISIIGSSHFLFCAMIGSLSIKIILATFLFIRGSKHNAPLKQLVIVLGLLTSSMFVDLSWVGSLLQSLFIPTLDNRIVFFLIRISWGFSVMQYQSMALLVESLIDKNYRISLHQRIFISISSMLGLFFFSIAFIHYNQIGPAYRTTYEILMEKISTIYSLGPLMLTTLIFSVRKIYGQKLPKILKKQLKIIFSYIIAPFLIADFLQMYPFLFSSTSANFAMIAISSPLLTFAIFYCSRKVMGLRFLNINNHVLASTRFNFIKDFRHILEQLSMVTSIHELTHISQQFFKNGFGIPPSACNLYFRHKPKKEDRRNQDYSEIESHVETFIAQHQELIPFFKEQRVLITDEIVFNQFYEHHKTNNSIIEFLRALQADAFIPIFNGDTLNAYIIINKDARNKEVFSKMEQDEMTIFAGYLGNIINLNQNRNITDLIHQEKQVEEQLYTKHQEINQYKESISTFLKGSQQHKIGILFYKNNRFIFGNKDAHSFIPKTINEMPGHPLYQALKELTSQVEAFKISQQCITFDSKGNQIICSCLPNLEQNNLIITIYHPEFSDVIKQQVDFLKNPSEWEYLLYLSTTAIGKKINEYIPSSLPIFLNSKVDLLKGSLRKKALLLEAPEGDLLPTAELLHENSLRESLHVLKLQGPCTTNAIGIKLFGHYSLSDDQQEKPLLSMLDRSSTLFIQNIEYLDRESQEHLAEFINYGFYHILKSEQKVFSSVKIICSTTQNLMIRVQEKRFSETLFKALQGNMIQLPSLLHIAQEELTSLAEGILQRSLHDQSLKNLFVLSVQDKQRLTRGLTPSLYQFKRDIEALIEHKNKTIATIIPAIHSPEAPHTPQLINAARLGKKALQDPSVMQFLWNNFKNQNKIATFLGVNRSSVNRRCKEYNLE